MKALAMRRSLGSLPLQLLTFLVLPLVLFLILITFGAAATQRSAMRDLIASHDVTSIRGAAISLSEQIEQQSTVLSVLNDRMASGDSPQELIATLGSLPETIFDNGIAFYDSQGRIVAASPESRSWQNASEIIEAILTIETRGDRVYVPLITQSQNNTRIAVISHALTDAAAGDQNADIMVVGVTSLNSLGLSAVLDSFRAPSAIIYIMDDSGRILFHSDPLHTGSIVEERPYLQAAKRGESGANYYTDSDTGQTIVAFAPIPEAGWSLVQEQLWVQTISPLMRYAQATPLILLPGLLIAGGVLWIGVRRIVRPLQRLETRTTDLAFGNFESINDPVGGIAEIRSLQDTLCQMAARVQQYQTDLHHYVQATTRAQEDERSRLARELHDQTVQTLIAIDHREQRLKRHLDENDEGMVLLTELRTMTTEAINDLRRLIGAMRPIYLEDLGLIPALQMLARNIEQRDGQTLRIKFDEQGTPVRLTPEQEITLYRVAQEALNNVLRHSQATEAILRVLFTDDDITLSVTDNGKGFAVPDRLTELSSQGHFGLIGMRERANLIDAVLTIQSHPDNGTTVSICVPLTDQTAVAA